MPRQDSKTKILDQIRQVLRLHHYSIHTERIYLDWIKRYIAFHRMKSRDDLAEGEQKIEAFLTHLAVDQRVAAATQNQAMNALVFLYKRVLERPLNETINAVRAEKKTECARSSDPPGGDAGHSAAGGGAATDRETALRQRFAHHGGGAIACEGCGFSDEADYGALRQRRQGSRDDVSGFNDSAAGQSFGQSESVAYPRPG